MLFPPFRNLTKRLKNRIGTPLCPQVTGDEKISRTVGRWGEEGRVTRRVYGQSYNCNEGCKLLDELLY